MDHTKTPLSLQASSIDLGVRFSGLICDDSHTSAQNIRGFIAIDNVLAYQNVYVTLKHLLHGKGNVNKQCFHNM